MKRLLMVCVVASTSWAGATKDAFLERQSSVELVAAAQLSPSSRAALLSGLVTSTEPRFGVPTFFWVGQPPQGARTPKDQGLSAEQMARRVLFTHAELYRGDRARWSEARLTGLHELGDGGAVIATFQQEIAGTRVFRDEVKVALTKDYVPVAIAGYLTPSTKPLGAFALTPSTAATSALTSMLGRGVEASALLPKAHREGYQYWRFEDEPTMVRGRPVWFPLPEGLEPGYYLEVELSDDGVDSRYHSFVVSARDGAILFENDLTADATFKVWAEPMGLGLPYDGPSGNSPTPHPAGAPNGFQPTYVPQELVTREYGPISTMDPWLPPNATRTQGNNVFAYVDSARPNGFGAGDLSPTNNGDADAGVVAFDRVFDPTVQPDVSPDQRMAAATQLFYDINFFHDWYYDRGFDEAAGNAQASNKGRGGRENDALNAEGQDNSGRSNANMSTPSDGASPRMQMYIWSGTATERFTYGTTTISANAASFGPQTFSVSAEIVLVDDGDPSGTNGSINDGCQAAFVNSVMGKIALIDRGNCTFVQKVQNAQNLGALGVLIADFMTSNRPPELVGTPMPNTTIPAMSLTRAQGAALKTSLGNGAVTGTISRTATVDRDGTIDNSIIAHEWGHYISNRLIGDGNGLSAQQSGGMGEGWSDFHALLMMVRAEDLNAPSNPNWTGAWAVGGYTTSATSSQGHYYGVRRLPYSVDFAKNGLTFTHIQQGVALPPVPTAYGLDGSSNAEVHATGEVWGTMLWECYVALLRASPRLTFEQAQDRMLRYLVAAYKLTPIQPTFVEARDAILAAAVARDQQDFALFWEAFARRGLGMQAVAPHRDSSTNRPAVESFVVGNAVAITQVAIDDSTTSCDRDGILDVDEVGVVSVTVKNVGVGALAATTVTLSTSSPGLSFPNGPMAAAAMTGPFESATVRIPVTLRGVRGFQGVTIAVAANDPSLAVQGPVNFEFRTRLNADVKPDGSTSDDVEAPNSKWTVSNDPRGNTGSDWRIANDSATSHWWFGPNPASPADTFLTSPELVVGQGPFTLTFRHRFEFEADATTNYDGAVIELSTDGRTWNDVGGASMPGYTGAMPAQTSNPLRGRRGFVGKSTGYPSFITERLELGSQYAGQTVRLRFRIGSDDAASKKGWEVDELVFNGLTNSPFTSITPDPNTCSGNRAPTLNPVTDLSVAEGDVVQLTGSGTDPDGDAVTIRFVQAEGPTVELNLGNFVAPSVDRTTQLVFDVTAFDGALASMPQRLTVTVIDSAGAPVVTVPQMIEVAEGQTGTVEASARDPQSDVVSIRWRQVSGPTVELRDAMSDLVKFTAPYVGEDTEFVLEAIANDGTSDSVPARVTVLVRDMPLRPASDTLGALPKGCGCSTGLDLAGLAGLLLLGARRRKRS
jgi:hypothetical protein